MRNGQQQSGFMLTLLTKTWPLAVTARIWMKAARDGLFSASVRRTRNTWLDLPSFPATVEEVAKYVKLCTTCSPIFTWSYLLLNFSHVDYLLIFHTCSFSFSSTKFLTDFVLCLSWKSPIVCKTGFGLISIGQHILYEDYHFIF